jgi:two-component system phosphate regulon sensor histidine kinase PhoR
MQYDIWKFIVILCFTTLVGYSIGVTLEAAFVACIGIIVWQIFRLHLLHKWIENPRKNPLPETSGQFYLLHRSINRINAANSKRKRQMGSLLSQFRKAVGALPDTIILIDERGKIEWANSNAKKLLNIRWPEDSGVRFCDLVRHPQVEKHIALAIHKDKNPKRGVIINSLHNREQTLNIKCVRYTEELRMIIVRDVSRLIHINQMHTDFVANVSHELKTPLTVLRGYLEILEDSNELPSKFAKPLKQMNLQSARMQLIVSDLLYLAKLEDSETIKTVEPVDVVNLVTTIAEAVQPLLEDKGHKLTLQLEDNLKLNGSQSELHSAFSNLITNAIKYTPDNGSIKIRWGIEDDNVTFSVKDNGLGIAPHHLSRLTERFYRVDTDRSREGGGTGLGLAIVKHVLQRHGGEVEINSELSSGSEFKCLFSISKIV